MPRKDPDLKNAYAREWYAAHRDQVIASVTARKHKPASEGGYAGVCVNCGGPTVGINGPGSASDYCGKGKCKSAQHKARTDGIRAGKRSTNVRDHHVPPDTWFNPTTGTWE